MTHLFRAAPTGKSSCRFAAEPSEDPGSRGGLEATQPDEGVVEWSNMERRQPRLADLARQRTDVLVPD
jgi:hypothetical protein